jgi:hypothetical protein
MSPIPKMLRFPWLFTPAGRDYHCREASGDKTVFSTASLSQDQEVLKSEVASLPGLQL